MNTTVKRSIFGVLFLAVMIGCLLGGRYGFLPLFLFIQVQMFREFYRMTTGNAHKTLQNLSIALAVISFCLVFLYLGPASIPKAVLSVIPLLLVCLMAGMVIMHKDFKDCAYIFTALAYIGLPMSLSPFVVSTPEGYSGLLMLSFFIIIWSSDVGAYCFGLLLGRKVWPAKMCPDISPKKSWAGFVGGWLTVLLAAYILIRTGMIELPLVHVLIMASLMHVTGVFGDLFESLWKRNAGIKDSGNIIPGHGGLLDRFDSSLFAIPAGYAYLIMFELV